MDTLQTLLDHHLSVVRAVELVVLADGVQGVVTHRLRVIHACDGCPKREVRGELHSGYRN